MEYRCVIFCFFALQIFPSFVSSKPEDKFRVIKSNINQALTDEEIKDFVEYDCERMVVIRNDASDAIRLSCQSHDAVAQTEIIEAHNSYLFTFRPKKIGASQYWCTLEYNTRYARFFVYDEKTSYMCPREYNEVHQYVVKHDGVYVEDGVNNGGQKIRALFEGRNMFILWEEFNKRSNETDGFLYSGMVDGGMCSDLPEHFEDAPASVTICYRNCVILYENLGCSGENKQMVEAKTESCADFAIDEKLLGKVSAVKGC